MTQDVHLHPWEIKNDEHCATIHLADELPDGWCNATYDGVMCWPPTNPGTVVKLSCPPLIGGNHNQQAERRCLPEGIWDGREGDGPEGWTDYTACLKPEIIKLMERLYANSKEDASLKLQVAQAARKLEIVGLTLSLTTVLVSIFIFTFYRSLRNDRTRIHLNLFLAMMIQMVVRLTVYIDRYVGRQDQDIEAKAGIEATPILCEGLYVLLEYSRTVVFLWMFIEGYYLHNLLTTSVFTKPNHRMYILLGWGLPIIMTVVWAIVTAVKNTTNPCWWGYSLSPYFWILEGPRLTIVIINLLFLLNILRVLIAKQQASGTSETEIIRKAVRLAIVLLPLLGITNVLQMIRAPLEGHIFEFAAWILVSTFLTSFQGFFVAIICCALNQEVRSTISRSLSFFCTMHCSKNGNSREIGNLCMGDSPESIELESENSPLQDISTSAV